MSAPSRARVAVVTGAARGIGRRIAAHFVDSGYFVVVTDIDENAARTWIFNCVQAVAPSMIARKRGAIINLASVSSVRGGGAVGNVWYGATKAAVVAMTAGLGAN